MNPDGGVGSALRGSSDGPIGVFDSGVGGLTVAAALRRRLPSRPIVYLGDTARLPYGTKSAHTVQRYTERNVRFLVERGVSQVVVACNSASALALDEVGLPLFDLGTREAVGEPVPVLGVVEPGAAAAAEVARDHVGLVATEATVSSGAYERALRRLRGDLQVTSRPCPLLVPLVEEGWLEDPVTEQVVRRYVEPMVSASVDTVILGCTHYPLLRPVFAEVLGPRVRLVDSAEAVASAIFEAGADSQVAAADEVESAEHCPIRIFVTDAAPHFAELAERVLGESVELEWVDIPSGPAG